MRVRVDVNIGMFLGKVSNEKSNGHEPVTVTPRGIRVYSRVFHLRPANAYNTRIPNRRPRIQHLGLLRGLFRVTSGYQERWPAHRRAPWWTNGVSNAPARFTGSPSEYHPHAFSFAASSSSCGDAASSESTNFALSAFLFCGLLRLKRIGVKGALAHKTYIACACTSDILKERRTVFPS